MSLMQSVVEEQALPGQASIERIGMKQGEGSMGLKEQSPQISSISCRLSAFGILNDALSPPDPTSYPIPDSPF